MTDLSQSFNKILEQYVFATVNQVIDLAEPRQQAILVKLIIDIPADTPSSAAPQLPVFQSTSAESEPLPDQSSMNRAALHDRLLTDLFQRQMARNQANIAHIEHAIEITRQGSQARRSESKREPDQDHMALWHTRVLNQYQRYLTTLQTMQRHNRDRLSRLVASKTL